MQQAIVVASFGTTYDEGRIADIESLEAAIQAAFPTFVVRRAFTSHFVRQRLAARGCVVDSLADALAKLAAEGFHTVYVQPTLLTCGEEYDNKILADVRAAQATQPFATLAIGRPLLTHAGENGLDDYLLLANALREQWPVLEKPHHAVVFIGHGSPNRHNPAYEKLQAAFDKLALAAVVGVVEAADWPNFTDVNRRLQQLNVQTLQLVPLLLVSGDHANQDIAGPAEDSWRSRLVKAGYQVSAEVGGLGRTPVVQALFIQHLRDCMLT